MYMSISWALLCIYMHVVSCSSYNVAWSVPGKVWVSLCVTDSTGHHTSLYTAQFTYTLLDTREIEQLIMEHTNGGSLLQLDAITTPASPEETLELDRVLTATVQGSEVTLDWRTLLDSGTRPGIGLSLSLQHVYIYTYMMWCIIPLGEYYLQVLY